MKIIKIALCIMGLALVLLILSTPVINNIIAENVKKDILKIALPENTYLIDSISVAGKLDGNGNGMQFFAAILIKSELSIDELDCYYSPYRNNDWSYQVEVQTDKHINMIEHGVYSFHLPSDVITLVDNYIVYSWGNSDYTFSNFDLRGH